MPNKLLFRLSVIIGIITLLVIANDAYRDFLRLGVSAFCPNPFPTRNSRFFVSSIHSIYPDRIARQKIMIMKERPQKNYQLSSLFFASDSHPEPEQRRIRKILKSYKVLGRLIKKILKILVCFIPLLIFMY